MNPSIIKLNDDKTSISFNLPTLKGTLKFYDECEDKIDDILSFKISPMQKFLTLDKVKVEDPRQPGKENIESFVLLADIHKEIIKIAKHFNSDASNEPFPLCWSPRALRLTFSLSAIFNLYFFRYELNQEDWGLQMEWLHLLRLRYQALITLHQFQQEDANKSNNEQKGKSCIKDDELKYLKIYLVQSLRDWAKFCLNADNHFLFMQSNQSQPDYPMFSLDDIEGEIKAIVYQKSRNIPYDFFLLTQSGCHILDQLSADWFLRDRYDWLGAIKLTWYRGTNLVRKFKKKKWLGFTLIAFILIILGIFSYMGAILSDHYIGAVLLPVYILLLVSAFCCFKWRPIANILLPRLWVGILVGYLPLLMTGELWIMSIEFNYWYIFMLNAFALFLSFLYLRWEIGNKVIRMPEIFFKVLIRSLIIIVYGFFSSFLIGLIILDLVGGPLIRASFEKGCAPIMRHGIFGEIYLKGLWLFVSFALLIGIIIQIFWEEKSITHPI